MTTDTITPTETAVKVLDKIDVSALRKADRIAFGYSQEHGSEIRCIFEASEKTPYEQTRYIACDTSLTAYSRDKDHWNDDPAQAIRHAFAMIHCPTYSEEWKTISGLLKAGDRLTLEWLANCGNDYEKNAGLYHDILRLIVYREHKRVYTFVVETSVCPDNSARMCRRYL